MKNQIIAFTFLLALLPVAAGQSVTVEKHFSQTKIQPGSDVAVGHFTLETNNTTAQLTDIVTNRIPFNVSYSTTSAQINGARNISVNASVPENFQPATYSGEALFLFSNQSSVTASLDFTVPEVKKWNVTRSNFSENVSVGSSGRLGTVKIENTGNVPARLDVTASGNISEYLVFTPSTSAYEGVNEYTVNYEIPEDTKFGYYTGNVTFTDGNRSEKVGVETRFLDTILPSIGRKKFENFEATKPPEFKVLATDNLRVASVTAEILYQVTVQRGNESVTVNRTLETVEFEKKENSNTWTGVVENDRRIDSYLVQGQVVDAAGNTVNFTDRFNVSQLDVVSVEQSVELPTYKYGSTVTQKIGRIDRDTPVTITLNSFNQPLKTGESDWRISLDTPSGKKILDTVNDSVTVERAQDLTLNVYGSSPARYQGELLYNPIEEHVAVPSTTFYGSFVNYTSPKDTSFVMFDKLYKCDGQASNVSSRARWTCQFNISAERVEPGSSLTEEVQFIIPREAKQDYEQRYQSRIQQAKVTAANKGFQSAVAWWIAALSLTAGIYTVRYYPKHYGAYLLVASRRKQAKEASKKLLKDKIMDRVRSLR